MRASFQASGNGSWHAGGAADTSRKYVLWYRTRIVHLTCASRESQGYLRGRVQRGIRSRCQLRHRSSVRRHEHGLRVAPSDADAHYAKDASLAERRRGLDLCRTRSRRGPSNCCNALVHHRRPQERSQQGPSTRIEDEADCLLGTSKILVHNIAFGPCTRQRASGQGIWRTYAKSLT